MNLGLDIDGTITAAPKYFAQLATAWRNAGRQVHVISSRSDTPEVRLASVRELETLGVCFDGLHLLPGITASELICPHPNLNWYAKYQWQKVAIAQQLNVSVYFDDDEKVLDLFRTYASTIQAFAASPALEGDRSPLRGPAPV
jgi:hypothetical protein